MCGVLEKRPGICDVEISERSPAKLSSINTWEQVGLILYSQNSSVHIVLSFAADIDNLR